MTLAEKVAVLLAAAGHPHAVIGAMAMAVHGISRGTADFDFMVGDPEVLKADLWAELASTGASVVIRKGDVGDPLAGVVRIEAPGDLPVDVVVFGGLGWQREAALRAETAMLDGARMPVVRPADLVLLKLYAGGPQDAWDIEALLSASTARDALCREVESRLARLPSRSRRLWTRITSPTSR